VSVAGVVVNDPLGGAAVCVCLFGSKERIGFSGARMNQRALKHGSRTRVKTRDVVRVCEPSLQKE
jgi:hypothetical protein